MPALECCDAICDARLHSDDDLAAGIVHCLVSLPGHRPGEARSFMLTHRPDGSTIRSIPSHKLAPGTRMSVRETPLPFVRDESLEDTVPRRTLAQELFARRDRAEAETQAQSA
jgi:hypothetical protein